MSFGLHQQAQLGHGSVLPDKTMRLQRQEDWKVLHGVTPLISYLQHREYCSVFAPMFYVRTSVLTAGRLDPVL
jgi:hypothetical protein